MHSDSWWPQRPPLRKPPVKQSSAYWRLQWLVSYLGFRGAPGEGHRLVAILERGIQWEPSWEEPTEFGTQSSCWLLPFRGSQCQCEAESKSNCQGEGAKFKPTRGTGRVAGWITHAPAPQQESSWNFSGTISLFSFLSLLNLSPSGQNRPIEHIFNICSYLGCFRFCYTTTNLVHIVKGGKLIFVTGFYFYFLCHLMLLLLLIVLL